MRSYRLLARLSQQDLAERVSALNVAQKWTQATVSEIERYTRPVIVDELLALALALEVSLPDLLDPHGPDGRRNLHVDLAGPGVIHHEIAHAWMRDRITLRLEWTGDAYKPGSLTAVPRAGNDGLVMEIMRSVARDERKRKAK
jgi:transcriptional regulator with XRE-family HTH domain